MEKNNFQKILTSNTLLKNFLREKHLFLKKRFGQNFLFDKNIILKIINSIPLKGKNVIEIGSGIGNLTLFYYQIPKQIHLIEIDKGFKNVLQDIFPEKSNISIIHSDFLKFNLQKIIKPSQKYIIISSLPYKSASQILIKFLDHYEYIKEIYIIAPQIYNQKFICEKEKFDNRLGLLLNLFFKIEKLFNISKNCFFPVPKIDSVFMKLTPEKKIEDIEKSRKILTLLFRQKRRKLKKILEKKKNREVLIKFYHKRIDQLTLGEVIDILENFI